MQELYPQPIYRWERGRTEDEPPEVSIVIPTYNRRHTLELVLKSLKDQVTVVPFEVIIVDDGSVDGTTRLVKRFPVNYPVVLLRVQRDRINFPRNPGPLRNLGVMESRAPLVIFLDSDMVCSPEFVQAHYLAHDRDKLVVTGVFIHTYKHTYPVEENRKLLDFSRAFLATGNASVKREWLLAAGLFDPRFREYGWEDLELGARLRQLGVDGKKEPRAVTYHLSAELTPDTLPGRLKKEQARARMAILYHQKHPTLRTAMATMNMPLCFWLAKVIFLGDWPRRPATQKLINWSHRRKIKWLRNLLCELTAVHTYLKELRTLSQAQ